MPRLLPIQNLDPDWYFEHVLYYAEPDGIRAKPDVVGPVDRWRRWWADVAARPDALIAAAVDHGLVLAPAEFDSLGVTRSRRRHEVRQGRWTSAGRGMSAPFSVVGDSDDPDEAWRQDRRRHALRTAAAARLHPGSTVSDRSAAILHGLPTLVVPGLPQLTDCDVTHGRLDAAHLFAAGLPDHEQDTWYGVPVESVGRTLVTLARHGRRDAIMAADAALRDELIGRDGLGRALDTAFGWPWVRQARAVLALADGRAESPLESLTRLALHDSGFPAPQLQVTFGNDRVDHYWAENGLVLEADGAGKYVGKAWLRERERQKRLLGFSQVKAIERVAWDNVTQTWPKSAAKLWPYFR